MNDSYLGMVGDNQDERAIFQMPGLNLKYTPGGFEHEKICREY